MCDVCEELRRGNPRRAREEVERRLVDITHAALTSIIPVMELDWDLKLYK